MHKFLGAIWGFDSMSTTLQQLLVLEKKLCKYKVGIMSNTDIRQSYLRELLLFAPSDMFLHSR